MNIKQIVETIQKNEKETQELRQHIILRTEEYQQLLKCLSAYHSHEYFSADEQLSMYFRKVDENAWHFLRDCEILTISQDTHEEYSRSIDVPVFVFTSKDWEDKVRQLLSDFKEWEKDRKQKTEENNKTEKEKQDKRDWKRLKKKFGDKKL